MVASRKRKKERKADFTKKRLKLGKASKGAPNAVQTDFTAKQLVLPTQSLTSSAHKGDRGSPGGEEGGGSRHDLMDCLGQLNHYSASTRRSAIFKVREIIALAKPEGMLLRLGTLMAAFARRIADEDRQVRREVMRFFQWWLPRLESRLVQSFASTLIIHTSSAMTNLYQTVRLDAVAALALWLERFPSAFIRTGRDGKRVLDCFLALLKINLDSTKASTVPLLGPGLPINDRLILFKTLSRLLKAFYSADDARRGLSGERPISEITPPVETSLTYTWTPEHPEMSIPTLSDHDPMSTTALPDLEDGEARHDPHSPERIFTALIDLLISSWLESAPLWSTTGHEFSADTSAAVEISTSVLEICTVLHKAFHASSLPLEKPVVRKRNLLLKKIIEYFPFQLTNDLNMTTQKSILDLNLSFCEMTSQITRSLQSTPDDEDASPLSAAKKQVASYLSTLLVDASSQPLLGESEILHSVLCMTLTRGKDELTENLYTVFVNRALGLRVPDAMTIQTINALVKSQLDPKRSGDFEDLAISRKKASTQWILNLPKIAWQLRDENPALTEDVIVTLASAVQFGFLGVELLPTLILSLEPLFVSISSKRGPVYGPFCLLESRLQAKILDLVYYLLPTHPSSSTGKSSKNGGRASDGAAARLVRAIEQAHHRASDGVDARHREQFPTRLERLRLVATLGA